jgi:flagellar biosynthesis protein FliQ
LDILKDLLTFALMIGAVVAIIALLAGLFMVIFSIATGVDEHLQE